MSPFRSIARAAALAASLALAACGGPPDAPTETEGGRSAAEQRAGDEAHPQILAQFGGAYEAGGIDDYVREIGMDLAAETGQPEGPWTFTVLDSPEVNAFALPGGYVYVTRGLIALANDEAELAGVVGHEIGHVTASHSAQRQTRSTIAQVGVLATVLGASVLGVDPAAVDILGQVGQELGRGALAQFSQSQEFEADTLGVRYLARAGYDPFAQADLLDGLAAQSALAAELQGGAYDPNRVSFFATHPATGDRVRQAIRAAEREGMEISDDGRRARDRFLDVIDGMTYGDSAEQGFVRGRRFIHPELRFAFEVAEGFVIANAAQAVTARGPEGSVVVFDGARDPGGSAEEYVTAWARSIAQETRTGRLDGPASLTIDGMEAARGRMAIATQSGERLASLTAIRSGDGTIYRFFGLAPPGDRAALAAVEEAADDFDALTAAQAARYRPLRVEIETVRAGQTIADFAARTPFQRLAEERLRVINDLGPGEEPEPGDRIKIVVE